MAEQVGHAGRMEEGGAGRGRQPLEPGQQPPAVVAWRVVVGADEH